MSYKDPGPCRVPIYSSSGSLYGSTTDGNHDWRLLERVEDREGWTITWYCTKCRVIDTEHKA